jgi:hypothetical protein
MYEEAANSLKVLVASDEFNAESRYLYGVALEGLRKHHEAATQLELSLRLAPQQEKVLIKLPEVYMAAYNESGGNADRKKAYQAALQLIQFETGSENGDLMAGKMFARTVIAKLDSPIGIWMTSRGNEQMAFTIDMFYTPPRLAMKEMLPTGAKSCGHTCWSFELKALSGPDYSGFGMNAPMQSIGSGCMFDYDYTMHLTDAGTKLSVIETAQKYVSPELTKVHSRTALQVADGFCRRFDGGGPGVVRGW